MQNAMIPKLSWRQRIVERFTLDRNAVKSTYLTDIRSEAMEQRSRVRLLYDDIGRFLFDHKLELTPLNFGCTYEYVSGSDHAIVAAFEKADRDGLISNGWIEDYVASHQTSVVTPAALEAMVEKVETELNASLSAVSSTAEQTAYFGSALETCSSDSDGKLLAQRLMALTRAMIVQTRLAEIEMRACHARVHDLQTTLRAARRASKTDPLTGLYNRRGFEVFVNRLLAGDQPNSAIVAICDLDHFKTINDRFGHDTGDRVLCYFARELQKLGRSGHTVARLGGEEFGILLAGQTLESAAETVHGLRKRMAGRSLRDRNTQESIGVVTFSTGLAKMTAAGGLSEALSEADAALYAAKRGGRDQICGCYGRGVLASL